MIAISNKRNNTNPFRKGEQAEAAEPAKTERTPAEVVQEIPRLIDTLRRSARECGVDSGPIIAALVLRCGPSSAELIWSDNPDPLKKLNALAATGARPVGLIAFYIAENSPQFLGYPLKEYARDKEVMRFLQMTALELSERKGLGQPAWTKLYEPKLQ